MLLGLTWDCQSAAPASQLLPLQVCVHAWLQQSHVKKKVSKQSKQMEKASCFNKNQTKPKCGVSGEVGFRAEPVTGGERGTVNSRKPKSTKCLHTRIGVRDCGCTNATDKSWLAWSHIKNVTEGEGQQHAKCLSRLELALY